MSNAPHIVTSDLERNFRALRSGQQLPDPVVPEPPPRAYSGGRPPPHPGAVTANFGMHQGAPMIRMASNNSVIYGQPMFFSPIHTPINWQIPSKRKETYQWLRYWNLSEPKVAAALQFYCFTPDTLVQMADGRLCRISDVRAGDRVVRGDGTTGAVARTFSRHGDEDIYRIRIAGLTTFPLKCTAGHELKIGNASGKVEFRQASTLQSGEFLLTPCPNPGATSVDKNLAWLVGLYAAEGCPIPSERQRGGWRQVDHKGVYFDLHLDEDWIVAEIKHCVEALYGAVPVSVRKLPETNTTRVAIYSSLVADELVGHCFGAAKTGSKRFSPQVFQWNADGLWRCLSGFFAGDGCYNPANGFQGVGVCRTLMSQVSHLLDCLQVPHSFTMSQPKNADQAKRQVVYNVRISRRFCAPFLRDNKKVSDHWTGESDDHQGFAPYYYRDGFIWRRVMQVETEPYTGPLHDLEIEGEHSYTANKIAVHNSQFPINKYTHELSDRQKRHEYDRLVDRLKLVKWLRIISYESHLLGDCFPFIEIECPICGGQGKDPQTRKPCEHPDGSFKRLVVLNPEYVELYSSPLMPDPVIALIPDDDLRRVVSTRGLGFNRLTPEAQKMIAAGQPIPLDNRNVSHIKFGETGYSRFGTSIVRRLFPILAYKTKLMTAQWIVAERMILPIKVVKLGSAERPAARSDLETIQSQIAMTANDPNLTIVTAHDFDMDWIGASGKVLTLGPEFELIAQEVLDGLMINKALLNGEGPQYANASIGIEAMIQRLEQWRSELAEWVEHKIYLPYAVMKGHIKENEFGEEEYVYPRIKWERMALRDQQQYRQFMLQLHEKGNISTQTLLESFDINYDSEVEKIRFERASNAQAGGPMGGMGPGGGMGGGFGGPPGGGGMGGPPGGPEMGGPGMDMGMGGGPPGMGGDMGMGAPGGGGMPLGPGGQPGLMAETATPLVVESQQQPVNSQQFSGKVLTEKSREKVERQNQKAVREQEKAQKAQQGDGMQRDQLGRVLMTRIEREMFKALLKARQEGRIRHSIRPQTDVWYGPQLYNIDFTMPDILLGIEADGDLHKYPDKIASDKKRDTNLAQLGWTILRFTEDEIESKMPQIVETIITNADQKEKEILGKAPPAQPKPQ